MLVFKSCRVKSWCLLTLHAAHFPSLSFLTPSRGFLFVLKSLQLEALVLLRLVSAYVRRQKRGGRRLRVFAGGFCALHGCGVAH